VKDACHQKRARGEEEMPMSTEMTVPQRESGKPVIISHNKG
jgi:hypothetical protein